MSTNVVEKTRHTAMGLLFIVSGMIVLVRQILIWTPDFVFDFLVNSEFTNEKVSVAKCKGICLGSGFGSKYGAGHFRLVYASNCYT